MKKLLITIIFLFIATPIFAAHLHLEKEYQRAWCDKKGGETEYFIRGDFTRVDCLLEDVAIEFDFAPKWAESIGQSLYYGLMTNRKAGVVLILENEKDDRFLKRLQKVADKYGIKVWTMTPEDLPKDIK